MHPYFNMLYMINICIRILSIKKQKLKILNVEKKKPVGFTEHRLYILMLSKEVILKFKHHFSV